MNWQKLTGLILVALIVGLCIYDVIAELVGGNEATISRRILAADRSYPGVTLALGVLVAHFTLPMLGNSPVATFIADRPWITLGAGVIVGALFFPQHISK